MAVIRIKVPDDAAPEVIEQIRKLALAQRHAAFDPAVRARQSAATRIDAEKLWRSVHEQIVRAQRGEAQPHCNHDGTAQREQTMTACECGAVYGEGGWIGERP